MTANSPTAPMSMLGSGIGAGIGAGGPAGAKMNRAMVADLLARLEAMNSSGAAKAADARGLLTELKSLAGESALSGLPGLADRPASVARTAEVSDRPQGISADGTVRVAEYAAPAPLVVRGPGVARERVYASVLYAPAPLFIIGRVVGRAMRLVGL